VRDPSIVYLLKELVAAKPGLCLVTTRVPIREIEGSGPLAATIDLSSLTAEDGVALLRDLGVRGSDDDLTSVVEQVDGHALSITLSGSYIVEALGGEIRSPVRVNLLSEDAGRGGHAWRVLSSYERWLEPANEQPHVDRGAVAQADLLQILRTISVFDRTVSRDRLFALFAKTRISGHTDRLFGLPDEAFLRGLYKLRDLKLVTLRTSGRADGLEAEPVQLSLLVDTHPLVRECFYRTSQTLRSRALRKMHRTIVTAVTAEIEAMKINQHYFDMAEFDRPHDTLVSTTFMNLALSLTQRHRR
jgi:hypothetical protein